MKMLGMKYQGMKKLSVKHLGMKNTGSEKPGMEVRYKISGCEVSCTPKKPESIGKTT